jgi:hypothetical protein
VTRAGLWIATQDLRSRRSVMLRLDPRTGQVTGRLDLGRRSLTALLAVGDDVWAVARDGNIVVIGAG